MNAHISFRRSVELWLAAPQSTLSIGGPCNSLFTIDWATTHEYYSETRRSPESRPSPLVVPTQSVLNTSDMESYTSTRRLLVVDRLLFYAVVKTTTMSQLVKISINRPPLSLTRSKSAAPFDTHPNKMVPRWIHDTLRSSVQNAKACWSTTES